MASVDPETKTFSYLPLKIYKNLKILLEYRKLVMVSDAKHSDQEFIKSIQYAGYFLIEAKDGPEKDRRFHKTLTPEQKKMPVKTFILLLDLDSNYLKSSANFAKALSRIPGFDSTRRNFHMEILIVSHQVLSNYLMRKLETFITEADEENGFIHIFPYKYAFFTSVRPEHKLVPPHRILTKEEEKEVLRVLATSKKNLPKIQKNEVICVWLGAETGDIVEVKIPSEVAGVEVKYQVVRP